jgi:hypothetical protein
MAVGGTFRGQGRARHSALAFLAIVWPTAHAAGEKCAIILKFASASVVLSAGPASGVLALTPPAYSVSKFANADIFKTAIKGC